MTADFHHGLSSLIAGFNLVSRSFVYVIAATLETPRGNFNEIPAAFASVRLRPTWPNCRLRQVRFLSSQDPMNRTDTLKGFSSEGSSTEPPSLAPTLWDNLALEEHWQLPGIIGDTPQRRCQ